jgi:hypothetical protein
MKTLFVVIVAVFAVALAIVVGSRLPVDAVAVIVGVVCGVLASIPTSLLVLAVNNRRESRPETASPNSQSYPPVVVVNAPPGANQGAPMWGAMPAANWSAMPPAAGPRQFRIIGQDSDNRYLE